MSASETEIGASAAETTFPVTSCKLVGVDIPFGDLVWLWIKVLVAAIPAALFLGLIASVVGLFVGWVASLVDFAQHH